MIKLSLLDCFTRSSYIGHTYQQLNSLSLLSTLDTVYINTLYYYSLVYRSCPYDGDFKCSEGKCLRSSQVCNGYTNCQSGEDEQNCGNLLIVNH